MNFLRRDDVLAEGNKKEASILMEAPNGYCISTACFDNVFVISQY